MIAGRLPVTAGLAAGSPALPALPLPAALEPAAALLALPAAPPLPAVGLLPAAAAALLPAAPLPAAVAIGVERAPAAPALAAALGVAAVGVGRVGLLLPALPLAAVLGVLAGVLLSAVAGSADESGSARWLLHAPCQVSASASVASHWTCPERLSCRRGLRELLAWMVTRAWSRRARRAAEVAIGNVIGSCPCCESTLVEAPDGHARTAAPVMSRSALGQQRAPGIHVSAANMSMPGHSPARGPQNCAGLHWHTHAAADGGISARHGGGDMPHKRPA